MKLNNRYQILKELGEGGFGKTFLAEDTQMPSGRYCVIKQLKPVAENSQIYQLVQERFQREAAILEDLGTGHPQIPTLYAYFREADLFYLVREWIEGETLTQKMQNWGVMSESTVKSLLVNLLPVFEYIHTRRIVHRDVKPDNIILRSSDNLPILIDFGAVRETMGTVVNSQGNPTSSSVIGTPGFMPSEQAAGRPVFSSDLYALGLTAIYLLTGKVPQELPTDPQTGEILWRQSALTVSPTFATILNRAIMSLARDRFSSAKEMLAALHGQGIPIASTVPSPAVNMPPTTPISHPSPLPPSPTGQSTSSSKPILLAGAIAGGLIGISTIVGLALTRTSEKDTTQTTPISETSNLQQESPPPTPTPQSTAVENINPANIPVQSNQGVGWIRIGAVPNSSTTIQDGIPLIATNQPVTIQPPVVPQNNSQVTILTGVNVRKGVPEPPNYDLTEQISVLPPGTKVIVLQKKSFVTPSNTSAVAVWAEVHLP
ncbi:MAG TPA: serine/threonine protein kinase [Oscillatoriales cyanobacterium M59_W2019_021]|nr:serine/threonine protein kinase [Oscillatoriales cyanobacterium M59_W2019_021]